MDVNSSCYTGQFVNYNSIHNYSKIWAFINHSKIYSNCSSNLIKKVSMLIEYEKKRKLSDTNRQKIYAIELFVMLPKDLPKNERHQVIKNFMLSISPVFKKVIYVYSFEGLGKGRYCRIIAFQRMNYDTPKDIPVKYIRDMWMNKITGRTCAKDDANAVHVCKKGEIKKDKNGNIVYTTIHISPKKYRNLNFKDDSDHEKKLRKFNSFKNRLLRKFVFSLSKTICFQTIYMKLRHKKFINNENEISKRILYYNSVINYINIQLQLMQNTFYYRGLIWDKEDAWKKFEHVFYNINQILKNGYVYLKGSNKVEVPIDPEFKTSFLEYKNNMNLFKNIVQNKIKNWYLEEFYDPICDPNKMEM